MHADEIEDHLTAARVVLMHLLKHMELMVPGFTVAGFRATLFHIEEPLRATMSKAEASRWEELIDQFLPSPGRSADG